MSTRVDVQDVIAVLLLVWLVATVAGQFGAKSHWIRSGFLGWCLPEWRLFAPTPGDHDYHLIYRTQSPTGEVSEFTIAQIYAATPIRALWNPAGRQQKMLRDVVRRLLAETRSSQQENASELPPYRLLLGVVWRVCGGDQVSRVQFAVLRETPRKSLDLVFLSSWHAKLLQVPVGCDKRRPPVRRRAHR
jgi:hypothetical protein